MTVHMQHAHHSDGDVAVIDGVDTPAAIAHLCHSLISGAGIEDQVVVIDLTGAPGVASQSEALLTDAVLALFRRRRWLGLVDPQRSLASGSQITQQVYRTRHDAIAAGRHYLRLMGGRRDPRTVVIAASKAVLGGASQLPGVASIGIAWSARTAWQCIKGPFRSQR